MRIRKKNRTKIQKDKFFKRVFGEMKENGTIPENAKIEDFRLEKVKSFGENNIGHIEEIEILINMLKNSSDQENGIERGSCDLMEFDPNIKQLFKDLGIVGDYQDKELLLSQLEQKRQEVNQDIDTAFNNMVRNKERK